jgi:hypothetical protein
MLKIFVTSQEFVSSFEKGCFRVGCMEWNLHEAIVREYCTYTRWENRDDAILHGKAFGIL